MSDITLSPFYHSALNEITQPDKFAAHSHYLTRRWKRELGPTGYAVLTSLRERCFYNRKTGELRNSIQVTVGEIAEECGVSERTVRRELDANKALQKFVRAQREYEPDTRRGGFRFGANSFQVAMDDPLHPADEATLIEIVSRRAEEAEKAGETPLDRARRRSQSEARSGATTSGQSDRTQPARPVNLTGRADNLTGGVDRLTGPAGQIDRTLNPDSSLPKFTSPDAAAAAPDFSLSLFEEKSPEPAPPDWAVLSEGDRAPWLDRARREIAAASGREAALVNPGLVETRARNLYWLAHK